MKRGEQIDNACTNWICSQENGTVIMARNVWRAAVEWAEQHHHWIPVDRELPKPNVYKEGKTFPLVLVCLNDGCCEDTDAYDTDNKTWCKYGDEVEYWMPIPTPPAPGKEEE